MKIRTSQLNIDDISNVEFDFVIACSGYETRAKYLLSSYFIRAKHKFCIGFKSNVDVLSREENDLFFRKNNFHFLFGEGKDSNEIFPLLEEICRFLVVNNRITILVDYSSMARVWYSTLLQYIYNKYQDEKTVRIIFSYSQSQFIPPIRQESYNCEIEPIQGYYTISIPHKPTALIISLGYIEKQAYGLAEYFDAIPYLFVNQNSSDDPFYLKVLETNRPLIESVRENHIFTYALSNLEYAESLLYQLCNELKHQYRVIIAPCGPKPFTLLSLIVALRLKNVDIWRISAESPIEVIDKKPNGNVHLLEYSQNGVKLLPARAALPA